MKPPEKPLRFSSRAGWRAWLERHHAQEPSVWLVIQKKKSAGQGLRLAEAVEEALCFGWIDGALKPATAEIYFLRFSPRKTRSNWSAANRHRAEDLIRRGQMTSAGLQKIAEAKANGEWDAAIDREDVSRVPDDLEQALKAHRAAWQKYESWPPSRKKQYLHWLTGARTPETRRKRIAAIITIASNQKGRKP